MAGTPITRFNPAPALLRPLADCVRRPAAGQDPEWPDCVLSARTVVYGSGVIARRGDPVRHAVDPDELALCRRLAKEAWKVARPIDAGLDSEGEFAFHPFLVAASAGDPPAGRLDHRLVRARFGGTIFPPTEVRVERICDRRAWWSEVSFENGVREDDESGDARAIRAWRALAGWFLDRAEFRDRAFVAVGDAVDTRHLRDEGVLPPKALGASAFPRLVVGLTRAGSLAGVVGVVTQT